MNWILVARRSLIVLLVAVFAGVVFHAPISVGFGTLFPDVDLLIKAWKEILMGLALVILLFLVTYEKKWARFRADPVLLLAAAFAAVHVLLLPYQFQGAEVAAAGLLIDLRFVLYFVLVYVSLRLYPVWRRPLLISGAVAAAATLVFSFLQVTVLPHDILKHIGYGTDTIVPYLTVDRSYEYIRITGTFRGPNPLGAYMVIVLSVAAAIWMLARRSLTWPRQYVLLAGASLLAAIALWYSYSRSALGAAVLAVATVLGLTIGRTLPRWAWISGVVVAGVAIGLLAVSWNTAFVQQVLLHNNPTGGSSRSSNDEHVDSLIEGTERLLSQPLGAGIGSTGSASLMTDNGLIIENQYLFIAHEVGWTGLALYIALFAFIMWLAWKRRKHWPGLAVFASGIGLTAIGVLLPVWTDDTVSIVWWGLAAMALSLPASGSVILEQTRNKHHARTLQ